MGRAFLSMRLASYSEAAGVGSGLFFSSTASVFKLTFICPNPGSKDRSWKKKKRGIMVVGARSALQGNLSAENLPPTICCCAQTHKHCSKSWLHVSILPVLAHTQAHAIAIKLKWLILDPSSLTLATWPVLQLSRKQTPQGQTPLFHLFLLFVFYIFFRNCIFPSSFLFLYEFMHIWYIQFHFDKLNVVYKLSFSELYLRLTDDGALWYHFCVCSLKLCLYHP